MTHPINWERLGQAVEFYKDLGFDYVETPWKVDPASAQITCPPEGELERVGDKALVASGEQGFLDLERRHSLPFPLSGVNFVTCTPCFRGIDEGRSPIHFGQFMKVELFVRCQNEKMAKYASRELLARAYKFMERKPRLVETADGWDLEMADIEVGSYGYRHHKEVGWWAYGTGLAEPRYSQARLALGFHN